MAAGPASAKTLIPPTRGLVVWNRPPESWGPSDRESPPIDQDDITPRAASRNAGRTWRGTDGRCGVSRRRAGARDAVGQRDGLRIAAGVKVEQRRASGPEGETGCQPCTVSSRVVSTPKA